jgi:hypothetical protein
VCDLGMHFLWEPDCHVLLWRTRPRTLLDMARGRIGNGQAPARSTIVCASMDVFQHGRPNWPETPPATGTLTMVGITLAAPARRSAVVVTVHVRRKSSRAPRRVELRPPHVLGCRMEEPDGS